MNRTPWNKGKILETRYPQLRDAVWFQEQLNCKSMQRIAKDLGCSYKRVYDAKIELGVAPQNGSMRKKVEPKYPIIEQNQGEITSLYLEGKMTAREIAQKFNVPRESILYYLGRKWKVGKPLVRKIVRPDGKVISKEAIESVYYQKGITSPKAAKQLGISLKAFRSFLVQYGLKTKKREADCVQLRDHQWLQNEFINKGKSQAQIARDLGVSKSVVCSAIKHIDLELRKSRGGNFGENASNWQGGKRRLGTEGVYVGIYMPEHPYAAKDGYIMEHRLVLEKSLGRYLTSEEIVHHKNGDKKDNRLENLELVSDRGTHTRDHFERSHVTELAEIKTKELQEALRQLDPNHPLLTNR